MEWNLLKRIVKAVLRFFEHKQTHAFHVHFEGKLYYVCARCSGLYLGIILGFALSLLIRFTIPEIMNLGDLVTDLLCLAIAMPTLIDWITQRLALRESTNRIRFTTALLAGFSLAWYLIAPVTLLHKLIFLFIILAFISIFSFIDRRPPTPVETIEEENSESSETGVITSTS